MSKWLSVGVGLLAACSLLAQGRGPQRDFGLGWGNVVFPGGFRPYTGNVTGFASGLGNTVAGTPYTGAPSRGFPGPANGGFPGPGNSGFGRNRRSVIVPVPVYVGGYYGYTPAVEAPPNVTVILQPPAGQSPVVFNQNYMPGSQAESYSDGYAPPARSSGLRSYEAPLPDRSPEPAAEQAPAARASRPAYPAAGVAEQKATIYLIAFRDQSIQAAYAYWVDGNTLHYVTVQGSHNRATLDLIDRDMSDRLNHERGIDFSLTRPY